MFDTVVLAGRRSLSLVLSIDLDGVDPNLHCFRVEWNVDELVFIFLMSNLSNTPTRTPNNFSKRKHPGEDCSSAGIENLELHSKRFCADIGGMASADDACATTSPKSPVTNNSHLKANFSMFTPPQNGVHKGPIALQATKSDTGGGTKKLVIKGFKGLKYFFRFFKI